MGEHRAVGKRVSSLDDIDLGIEDPHLLKHTGFVCLRSIHADNLKYVHNYAVGYNNCKPDATCEEALMSKNESINGEISHAF